jgi:hypothetical protein
MRSLIQIECATVRQCVTRVGRHLRLSCPLVVVNGPFTHGCFATFRLLLPPLLPRALCTLPAVHTFPCPSARAGTLPLQLQRRRLKNQPTLTASWRKKAKAHRKSICVHGWTALSRSGSMPNTCKELLRWRNGRRLARLCRSYLILKRRSPESALCSRIGGARLSGLRF